MLNGIALRLEGREIETTGLKAILDRHERWLGDLGRRVTELDGVKKEWPAQLLGGRLGLRGDLVGGALSNPSDHAESMA